jgi:hypothetical protein
MAFANVSSLAGLINNSTTSSISSFSTQSGASWFSIQFFYSPQFYSNAVDSNPEDLSDFILKWMDSYEKMSASSTDQKRCDNLDKFTNNTKFKQLEEYCTIFTEYNGDWAAFTTAFLSATSTGYGDPTLVDRLLSVENRIPQMAGTDLYVQTTLAPNSPGTRERR